jgi:hypothetical protein
MMSGTLWTGKLSAAGGPWLVQMAEVADQERGLREAALKAQGRRGGQETTVVTRDDGPSSPRGLPAARGFTRPARRWQPSRSGQRRVALVVR